MKRVKKVCNPGEEFYFKLPDNTMLGKAASYDEFVDLVHVLPAESLYYHQANGHFAPWLRFIGEKAKARRISMLKKVTPENIRIKLLKILV
ncbi:hypothetical protein J7J90_04545 [Candidatus Micrarchaeota archaeon]|nr:hypothetical protein [Candidatus Micrarchaeota archaeon]